MLKRLELVGFKSFADKTVFEFPRGITAVVGPNGSGKSNVVDAVKWVLGEQSAKSLRGDEMADVIFNGSTSRKGLGIAEVSLTFDNSNRSLATDMVEVRVTRRVYRDGQGEYLINGQICRLKDIRDLFLGSGAGTEAYSIIEQGRVDALLQASVDDRRAIFEEAAGISRYKQKKLECLRRLERVDQNLTRVQDILGEVDQQVRGVRHQAAKAEKYHEFSNRLRDLRLGIALREYADLTQRIKSAELDLAGIREALNEADSANVDRADTLRHLEGDLNSCDGQLKTDEQLLAELKARIAALESSAVRDRARADELFAELQASNARRLELNRHFALLSESSNAAQKELEQAQDHAEIEEAEAEIIRERLTIMNAAIAELRSRADADEAEHLARMREASELTNEATSAQALKDRLVGDRQRLKAKAEQANDQLDAIDAELGDWERSERDLQENIAFTKRELADKARRRDRARDDAEVLGFDVADMRARASGLASRIEVIEGLERSHDGLGSGIREVLAELANPLSPLADAVAGMVADCLTAPRQYAPLIDAALGPTAQSFVTRDAARLDAVLAARPAFTGQVEFVPLATNPPDALQFSFDSDIVRAVDLVSCDCEELAALSRQLLGTTLIVPDLATARRIAAEHPGHRFVTTACEVLECDGTLTVGLRSAESRLLSRKSELRELRREYSALGETIDAYEFDLEQLGERADGLSAEIEGLRHELEVLAEQENELRSRLDRHRERQAGLCDELQHAESELNSLDADIARHERRQRDAEIAARAADKSAQDMQFRREDLDREIHEREEDRVAVQEQVTSREVALARLHERVEALISRLEAIARELADREAEAQGLDARIAEAGARIDRCRLDSLNACGIVAGLIGDAERTETALVDLTARRAQLHAQARRLREEMTASRAAWQANRDKLHARELESTEFHHRRDGLAARLAEDYQIDLASVFAAETEASQLDGMPDDAAKAEIEELRKKLHRLGSVNLEATDELAEIEGKTNTLQTQFNDLTHARATLEDIIQRINVDSKKMFEEMFATVRIQFQELFRRLFGGGMADVKLERPDDPLESGIEIVAQPPGKELRSIGLMSGGERTLTAVALLLAIFRSKPSPFCLLDEVDAALDESNAARLTTVLREFAQSAQFIVITHAKRTMAAADVLYGITMQESGISKRVAVRFEDWPSDDKKAA